MSLWGQRTCIATIWLKLIVVFPPLVEVVVAVYSAAFAVGAPLSGPTTSFIRVALLASILATLSSASVSANLYVIHHEAAAPLPLT